MFIGFAGNLVVGVWLGRDDNKSLGKISGGTVPAQIWRNFMSSALAVDHEPRSAVADEFHRPEPKRRELKSPLPPEWSDATKQLRDVAKQIEGIFDDR